MRKTPPLLSLSSAPLTPYACHRLIVLRACFWVRSQMLPGGGHQEGVQLNLSITVPVNVVSPCDRSPPPRRGGAHDPAHWSIKDQLSGCTQFYRSSPASLGYGGDLVPSQSHN